MAQFIHTEGEINTPFPDAVYAEQLNIIGLKNEKELSFSKLVSLMSNIIGDFIKGKISFDNMSDMFQRLEQGFFLNQSEKKQDKFAEIGVVLFNGGELNYYIRASAQNGDYDTFAEYLNSLIHFYNMRETIQKNVHEFENTF